MASVVIIQFPILRPLKKLNSVTLNEVKGLVAPLRMTKQGFFNAIIL